VRTLRIGINPEATTMKRWTRQLVAVATAATALLVLQAAPAGASETVGSCVFEEILHAEEEGLDLHALEEREFEEELEKFEEDLEGCLEAPNPILPETNEIIWGGGAFLVLFFFMAKFGFPAVKRAMDARADRIRADLDEADQAKADAKRVQAEYEAKLADAKAESNRMIDEARVQADELKQELQARAEADIAEMRERAAAELETGRQQAINDLRSEVSEIALGAAERVVGASLDRDAQSQLIDAYIDEVASSNGH
jgi:F-type H+-transporting ATPase subunit b